MPTDFNDPTLLAALERLTDYYNSDAYDATTNPGGFANNGHQANFIPSLQDFGALCNALSSAVDTLNRLNLPDVTTDNDGQSVEFLVINGAITANLTGTGTGPGYDVYLMWGQSNMRGEATPIDPAIDTTDARIQQWPATGPSAGTRILASDPLIGPEGPKANKLGPAMTFARARLAATGRKILLVPAAVANTAMVNGAQEWAYPSGSLYTNAVSLANAAMASDADNVFAGIIGAQGENDGGISFATRQAAMDAVIDGFRADITGASASTPFIFIQMPGSQSATNDADDQMIFRKAHTAFVYTPRDTTGLLEDGVHWNEVQARINGANAASEGYPDAIARTSISNGATEWGNYDRWQRDREIVLESGNHVATRPGRSTSGAFASVRSKRGYISGRHYAELKLIAVAGAVEIHAGVACQFDFTSASLSVGGTFNVGFRTDTGSMVGASPSGAPTSIGDGDTLGIDLDLGAQTVRYNKNGGTWSSAATLPGGFSVTNFCASYLWCTLPIYSFGTTASAKIQLPASPTYTVPSGATYWGS